MKKDLTKFLFAVCLMFTASLFSQSTTSSYTQTLRFFSSDNLQIYQGARIAAPTMTLPNSLTTYTSSLAFGNSDLRQIYNAVRGMGDATSGFINSCWSVNGNSVTAGLLGTTSNNDFAVITNNLRRVLFGSNGVVTISGDSIGFNSTFVVDGGRTVNGANPDILLKSYYNGRLMFQNTNSPFTWYLQNGTTSGSSLNSFFIGSSNNTGLSAVRINSASVVNIANNLRVGSLTTLPSATIDVTGTMSVSSTSTLTGLRNNGTFTTTGAAMIGGTTARSATLHVLGTASVSGSSTLTGVRNNGTVSCTGNFSTTARLQFGQGVSVASTAGAMTVGGDGNVFEITGTNAITAIANTSWQNGSEITLYFTSTASLTDGVANSGANIGFELAGNVNFTATADDALTLVLCTVGGTQRWREKCRSIN